MNKKTNRMVPLLMMTALAAVPIILWFFGRAPKRKIEVRKPDSFGEHPELGDASGRETAGLSAGAPSAVAQTNDGDVAHGGGRTLLTQQETPDKYTEKALASSSHPDVGLVMNETSNLEVSNSWAFGVPDDGATLGEPTVIDPPKGQSNQSSDVPVESGDGGESVLPKAVQEIFHEAQEALSNGIQSSPAQFEGVERAGNDETVNEEQSSFDESLAEAETTGLPAATTVESIHPAIEDEQASLQAENDNNGVPRRYRPPPQRTPRRQLPQKGSPRPAVESSAVVPYEVSVRLLFDRFEYCTMSILPERKPDLDDELDVRHRAKTLRLVGQEDWYEDLQFDDMGSLLSSGLELNGTLEDNRRVRWLLAGRDIYVFASHPRVSGLVSSPRLALGRSHVVVCTEPLLTDVESILASAGCHQYVKFGSELGLPKGWTGIKRVVPMKPLPLADGIDSFYAIKPATDVEIELEGGICIRSSTWLAGFTPRIRLLGDTSNLGRVLIDGHPAELAQDGSYTVEGCELPGEHEIICEGLSRSRSYSIEESPSGWHSWVAYRTGTATLCGPLVQPRHDGQRIISVPMSNPLLLGSEPGEIYRCARRHGAVWTGYVPFEVVWALPYQPLICNKKEAYILQFSDRPLLPRPPGKRHILRWCIAILDASRKGLQIRDVSASGASLWREYKKAARNYWRAAK